LADFAYDAFAQVPIAELEELRLAAVEDRIEADLELGRHEQLVGELGALVKRNRLRERLRMQLMLALYRCGRQAEALEVYQEYRHGLADELGLEPAPALSALQVQILEQAPSLEAAQTNAAVPGVFSGTVTFLVADVQGSTRLLGELGGERFGEELVTYRGRVRKAVAAHGGRCSAARPIASLSRFRARRTRWMQRARCRPAQRARIYALASGCTRASRW
jgi:hypothetical protein